MPVDTSTNVKEIEGRAVAETSLTDGHENVSGGITATLAVATSGGTSATLFVSTQGAIDLKIEFSPDGGVSWYEPAEESPIEFSGAGQDLAFIEFDASDVRITGSNETGVNLDLRVTA